MQSICRMSVVVSLSMSLVGCREDKVVERDLGAPVNLLEYVDPMIATGGVGYGVNCGYPGATVPLGMVKISPDTAMAGGAADGFYRGGGYHYDDVQIQGFAHMHLYATGITGYGVLATMPVEEMTAERTVRRGYGAFFSHDKEWAEVGKYSVDLDVAHVELSATAHTALHQYEFTDSATVLIDIAHAMGQGVVSEGNIVLADDHMSFQGSLVMDGEMGAPFPVYFYGELDTEPVSWGVWQEENLQENIGTISQTDADQPLGMWLDFPPQSTVKMRIALSNIDMDGAKNNFAAEHTGFDIETDQQNAQHAWQEALDVIQVWGGSDRERRIFATALYHNLQMPTLFSDVDRRYRGFDGAIHQADRYFYTDFSLWDTYRTTHPLYSLLWPDLHSDLLWSLTRMSIEGNGLPRWPLANTDTGVMLGTSINIVIPEAVAKNVRGFGEEEWLQFSLEAMLQERTLSYGAPPDLSAYEELGYYPADEVGRSVAWTQEQSIADFALGTMAKEWGYTSEGEHLLERSKNWRNLWNPDTGYVQGKNRDGSFREMDPVDQWSEDYAEGNARQYLWLAPHDTAYLFDILGGNQSTLDRLQEMFVQMTTDDILTGLPERWYWHGNEPTLHVPWLFAMAGDRERGNQWNAWLLENRYADQPTGLAGNDDGGALSAWAVFAMMGIYPLAGTTEYVLGEPVWDAVAFQIPTATGLQNIRIEKISSSEDSAYPAGSIVFGENLWEKNTFNHAELLEHAQLKFYTE